MIPISLGDITLHPRHHLSALWWLGLLYRRPYQFRKALEQLHKLKAIFTSMILHLHFLLYIIIICALGRLFLFGFLDLQLAPPPSLETDNIVYSHILIIAFGIAFGIAYEITYWIIGGIFGDIAYWIVGGIVGGIAFGIAFGISFGISGGIVEWIAFGIAFGIAVGIYGGISFGIAVGISVGMIVFGIAFGISVGIALLRAYYYILHPFFIWPKVKGNWYRFHPAAWDNMCSIPFPGLDRLLVTYSELEPDAGVEEIERLISSYPSQRMNALRARTTLLARQSKCENNLTRLDSIVARLPEGDKGFLAQTPHIKEAIGEIYQIQQRLDTMERPIFREPLANSLRKEIKNFYHVLGGYQEPLASEFRTAAQEWLKIAEHQWQDAQAVLSKEPTPQIFRAGDPVDSTQEAFVERNSVIGELERQIMLSTGCPGLIIYGRRRMGKSTILKNLSNFLPPSVCISAISMQNPNVFTSQEYFVRILTQTIRETWPGKDSPTVPSQDLSGLFNFLAECNRRFEDEGKRLFLALDEYENFDLKIGEGIFSKDLLATIRESIQLHRQLTWVFAGSHDITELNHAPWPSYLISVRTVEVPPFSEAETRLLLTDPLKHSKMWKDSEFDRPPFDSTIWGEGGIERIHAEAGGWPHLVQLIAETIVDFLNDEKSTQADDELFERSLNKAIIKGDTVLHQLIEGECMLPGEWEYLRGFRTHYTQSSPDDETIYRFLRRRLLVIEENNQWRMRVPLMQRWLRERG